uniref:(California timema) hypothetical protein n=1 Tax=Timema californicum TaxID=61474 RepID=A0A7R9P763_TIMCA|nr:unnamed protein product [Timema californicum]
MNKWRLVEDKESTKFYKECSELHRHSTTLVTVLRCVLLKLHEAQANKLSSGVYSKDDDVELQEYHMIYSSPMASLVLTDSSQLTADGFEKLPDQITYPYAEPYNLQKHGKYSLKNSRTTGIPATPWTQGEGGVGPSIRNDQHRSVSQELSLRDFQDVQRLFPKFPSGDLVEDLEYAVELMQVAVPSFLDLASRRLPVEMKTQETTRRTAPRPEVSTPARRTEVWSVVCGSKVGHWRETVWQDRITLLYLCHQVVTDILRCCNNIAEQNHNHRTLENVLAQFRAEGCCRSLANNLLENYFLTQTIDHALISTEDPSSPEHSDNSSLVVYKALVRHMTPPNAAIALPPVNKVTPEGNKLAILPGLDVSGIDRLVAQEERHVATLLGVTARSTPHFLGRSGVKTSRNSDLRCMMANYVAYSSPMASLVLTDSQHLGKQKASRQVKDKVVQFYQQVLWGEVGSFMEHVVLWWGSLPMGTMPQEYCREFRNWLHNITVNVGSVPVPDLGLVSSEQDTMHSSFGSFQSSSPLEEGEAEVGQKLVKETEHRLEMSRAFTRRHNGSCPTCGVKRVLLTLLPVLSGGVPPLVVPAVQSLIDGLVCHVSSTSWDQLFRRTMVFGHSRQNNNSGLLGPSQGTVTGQLFCGLLQSLVTLSNSCEVTTEWMSAPPIEDLPLVEQIPVLHRLDHSVHTARLWAANRARQLANSWTVDVFFLVSHADINSCLEQLAQLQVQGGHDLKDTELTVHVDEVFSSRQRCTCLSLQLADHKDLSSVRSEHMMVCAKMRAKLVSEVRENIAKLKKLSDENIAMLAAVCRTISLANLRMCFPGPQYWKQNLDPPKCASPYVEKYLDRVLRPVLLAVVPLPVPVQKTVGGMVIRIMCEAWLDHIYSNNVKFTEWGAVQLLNDFGTVPAWLSERVTLSPEVLNCLLRHEVLRRCEGVGRLLLRRPGEHITMVTAPTRTREPWSCVGATDTRRVQVPDSFVTGRLGTERHFTVLSPVCVPVRPVPINQPIILEGTLLRSRGGVPGHEARVLSWEVFLSPSRGSSADITQRAAPCLSLAQS